MKKVNKLFEKKKGILLDFGCGGNKTKGFVGMDKRKMPGVDIVHDIEKFPWPIPSNSCLTVVGHHVIEHIKPWLTIDMFNEIWRILKDDCQVALSCPYAGSPGYYQDPTHCNCFTERTFWYFDPSHWSKLYNIYTPKPWKIEPGFPQYQPGGNLEVVMKKVKEGVK